MIIETEFKGVKIIKRKNNIDKRGSLEKIYNNKIMMKFRMDDIYYAKSKKKNTIRGLHYQEGEYSQRKIITCLNGSFIDIALDLRSNSKTFKKIFIYKLCEEEHQSIIIPKGFAHGIYTLKDNTTMLSMCEGDYIPEKEKGINILSLGLKFISKNAILSEKDKNLKNFEL